MATLGVEEIQTVLDLLHRNGVFLRAVLEDKLLKKKEGALVRDLLPHLDHRRPRVLRGELGALGALPVLDEELDLEGLFEDGVGEDGFLDGERDAEAFGVGFRPDEVRVGEADFGEGRLELFEADGEELLGLGEGGRPGGGRGEEAFAVAAERDRCYPCEGVSTTTGRKEEEGEDEFLTEKSERPNDFEQRLF